MGSRDLFMFFTMIYFMAIGCGLGFLVMRDSTGLLLQKQFAIFSSIYCITILLCSIC
jgi:hypothetical protein